MQATIFLNGFMHNTTPLARLFYGSNKWLEKRLTEFEYVHYSRQYECYYIRWRKSDFEQLKKDTALLANLDTSQLNRSGNFPYNLNFEPLFQEPPKPKVSITLVDEKAYIRLPNGYRKEWVNFIRQLQGVYESKRRFWIVTNYSKHKASVRKFFEGQGCIIRFQVKQSHAKPKSVSHTYKEDPELLSFVKVMTLQGASKRTLDNYTSQIKRLKEYYDNKPMKDITDDEISDYLYFLREELGYSHSAQNIVVSAVKRFLLSLTDREFNPYHIPRPAKVKNLPKVLDKNEIVALLKQDLFIKHQCILYLLYATGIRCGELINLKVEDIRFENNIIIVKNGKGSKDRVVVMPERVKQLLLKYLQKLHPVTYLFEGQTGGQYSSTSVQRIVHKAVQKAGIDKRVTPHMLRHSFATHLHDSGMDIRNIQKLLGHTSTKTTEIYTYISKRDIRNLKSPLEDLEL
jgi:site-specific recombinase XerD